MECSTVLEQIVIPERAKEADAQTLYQVQIDLNELNQRLAGCWTARAYAAAIDLRTVSKHNRCLVFMMCRVSA